MYGELVESLSTTYRTGQEEGIEDQAFSRAITDIIIANYLGHQLDPGGKGPDGICSAGRNYEYKATFSGLQANFNIGRNLGTHEANLRNVQEKFADIEGVYFARLEWNGIEEIAYCSFQNLLPKLEEKLRNIGLDNDWVHPQISWDEFLEIEGVVNDVQPSEIDTYPNTVASLLGTLQVARDLGLDRGIFSKGAQNDVFLAQREGHRLLEGGGGADAVCRENAALRFEYKVSCKRSWMFNHGARRSTIENQTLIREKYQNIDAAYLATRNYHELVVIIRIPKDDLIRLLLQSEERTNASPMNLTLLVGDLRPFVIHPNPNYHFGFFKEELIEILSDRGLNTRGTKPELIQRLIEDDQEE